MSERIELTDPRDQAFARIAQGALTNETILPSGLVTPARDLVIEGDALVTPTAEQLRSFGQRTPIVERQMNFNPYPRHDS